MNGNSPPVDSRQIIEDAWRKQAVWSVTANSLKARLTKWRCLSAILGVLGAILETLAASLAGLGEDWSWLRILISLVGAVILAMVPVIVTTKASKERIREWVQARSASEALKEVIYRYLVGATPFGSASSPNELSTRCDAVIKAVQDLNRYAATIKAPEKKRPLTLTVEDYVTNRVKDQIEQFYRPKARENARKAETLHNVEFVLGLLAAGMGAVAGASEATGITQIAGLGAWVAVVTTAGGAVTAYLAAARYDHQAIIYYGTADRLTTLHHNWLSDPNRMDRTTVDKFVDDCEHAISTENEAWLARWTSDESENAA